MGLKAGWISLFVFVWVIGAFLGSTFEYQSTEVSAGMASTGTANFTKGSAIVTGSWNSLMAGGLIMCDDDAVDDDAVWYKISSVNSTTNLLTLAAVYAQAGGDNKAYTMQASPGWAGTGTGGYATSPTSKIEFLMDISNVVQHVQILGDIPLPIPNGDYFKAAFEVVTWQWSFMDDYGMFYWIFCVPFIVMGVLSMILLVYGILTGNLTW